MNFSTKGQASHEQVAYLAGKYYNLDYNNDIEKFVGGNSFANKDLAERVSRPSLGGIWIVDSAVESLTKNGIGFI